MLLLKLGNIYHLFIIMLAINCFQFINNVFEFFWLK
jgi:hypothetical protein